MPSFFCAGTAAPPPEANVSTLDPDQGGALDGSFSRLRRLTAFGTPLRSVPRRPASLRSAGRAVGVEEVQQQRRLGGLKIAVLKGESDEKKRGKGCLRDGKKSCERKCERSGSDEHQ